MKLANLTVSSTTLWLRRVSVVCLLCVLSAPASAVGTAVGTSIENTAVVSFDLAGTPLTVQSNTTTIVVAERINVTTTLQSPQTLVSPNDVNQALLFTVTNTGNGTEAFELAINSIIAGSDFDPVPVALGIYFDTDGSGTFNTGDLAYTPGVDDPVLAADASINIFLVNDIPGTVANGDIGRSELTATSVTGSGPAGTVFANQGDGGVNAVIGTTTGTAADVGEYLVSDVQISVIKSQVVSDPTGGTEPIPGATITYSIAVEVTSAGVATASTLADPIPIFTTFVADSITLDGAPITDIIDGDAGELDTTGAPTVVVRLGDLDLAAGITTIVFQVTID